MAKLVDVEATLETIEDLPIEDKVQDLEQVEDPVEDNPKDEAPEVPEKYQGKSVQELVRMHQEVEKALGKQGSEVGELRKIVDNFISNQPVTAPQEEPVTEDETDWFADPDKALNERLERHPALKAAEEAAARSTREANKHQLEQKHPDYQDILQEKEFADWIAGSKVRTKLFIDADQKYDTDAADELFSTYKERRALASQTVKADKESRSRDIAAASTGGARGSETKRSKPKYRRTDIIDLIMKDPDRYASLQKEILQAYREKRVY